MSSIWQYTFVHPILNEVLDSLTLRQFFRETNTKPAPEADKRAIDLSDKKLNKAALIASILASGPNDEHRQKAIAFAILAYLEKRTRQYAGYCYIILSRTDNIQQGKHLPQIFDINKDQFLVQFDDVLDLEISVARALATYQLPDSEICLSRFQKQLWQELEKGSHIMAMSGPTSSGKSFMIQNHLVRLCQKKDSFKGLYVVPTKALIYEVSSALRKRLNKEDVSIKIGFGKLTDTNRREIFVLTPERCLRLLKENTDQLVIDFIFFDEIQKIEDDERGVLFEHILNELLHSQKAAKIVLAGPYLKNLKDTVMDLCGLDSPTVESHIAPVYQLKAVFRISTANKDRIKIFLKSASGNTLRTLIPTKKALYSRLKTRQRKTMAEFMATYGRDSTNVIYAPTRKTAEKYAVELAELMSEADEINEAERIGELIDYLSNEIHPMYSLIRCLRKGVAFHHGTIPELAKLEIEELYKIGIIKNLACTTTLLEGVNLPADKIFIFRPFIRNRNRPLNDFEFGNLIGRAGRVSTKLNGSVYCIELDDEKWANEKLDSDFTKKIVPATSKAFYQFKDQMLKNITKPSNEMIAEQAVIYTIILLRHKALRSPSELVTYLKNKGLTQEEIVTFREGILDSVKDLKIPEEIVRLHPTLDPLLQDRLYRSIEKNEKEWFIDKHPIYRKHGKDDRDASFNEKNFYRQFEEIACKLDEIFDIVGSIIQKHNGSKQDFKTKQLRYKYNIYRIVYKAMNWIQEKPLREIIEKDLKREAHDLDQIDRVIREVIDVINNEVRFELVKYFNLWADILRSKLESYLSPDDPKFEEQRKWIESKLLIPEWLELGACTANAIAMIRSGINRSAAIEAAKQIPVGFSGDPISLLVDERLDRLSPIFQRHIKSQGF